MRDVTQWNGSRIRLVLLAFLLPLLSCSVKSAIRIQIWTALIAKLLLKWLHFLSRPNWSFSTLASMLRLNLYSYRDLQEWLNNPYGTPPIIPEQEQLDLLLPGFGQNAAVPWGGT